MNKKEYYVIQNSNGKFFKVDNISGGYPVFIDDFECCKRFNSMGHAKNFLAKDYATKLFKETFKDCVVRKVKIVLE